MSLPEIRSEVEVVLSLDERRDRIIETLESAAIDVGLELLAAKREHPGEFMAWVSDELPFGHDKAQRLMAVARFAGDLDPVTRANLPKAWTVLFELRRLDPQTMQKAVLEGTLSPETTAEAARALAGPDPDVLRKLITGETEPPAVRELDRRVGPKPGHVPVANRGIETDTLARELIRQPRESLTPRIADLLRTWLGDPE